MPRQSGLQRTRLPGGAYVAVGVVALLLMLVSGRYGFHRDELYFIESGHHRAWAMPDSPMLVPYLAAGWHELVGGHLWAFRILPALAVAGFCLTAGLIARELGGSRRHEVAAVVATALTGLVLATGHLFSTTTFDVAVTSATLWLLVKAVREGRWRSWLAFGLMAGVASEVKVLVFGVVATALGGLVLAGPRRVFRGPRLWAALAIMLALAAPNLVWQAAHGWPMREIAANIAGGGSASSSDRILLLPNLLLMVGPVLSVVMVTGVVWLCRPARRHRCGWIAVGFLLFVVLILIGGGKPYYPAGYLPALMAAGAIPLLDWVAGARSRRVTAVTLLAVSAVVTPLLTLPVAPVGSTLFRIGAAVNPDSAETVGWDRYIHTVVDVADRLPPSARRHTVVITGNYGEAGALTRAQRLGTAEGRDLPPVFSGHNGFASFGEPPTTSRTVVLVGWFERSQPHRWFERCRVVTRLESPPGVDNEEDGAPIRVCEGPREPWSRLWPTMAELG